MRVSELLGLRVVDAGSRPVGTVTDVRLVVAGELADHPPAPRMLGLIVSPRTAASYLGFERSGATAPAMLAAIARWRHRGTFLAAWEDIAAVGSDRVTLRAGYTRYSSVLRDTREGV
ncbi:MAG TPA: PRC-barrel domain-containing protein [Mycobacterium sp.]|nr:PRC-barrel domain-containing protein [Mycobacterium sp.]